MKEHENNISEENLNKKFNCVKCSVRVKDVKLLKLHYWKVHISKRDIYNAEKNFTSGSVDSMAKNFSSSSNDSFSENLSEFGSTSAEYTKKRKLIQKKSKSGQISKKALKINTSLQSDSSEKESQSEDDEVSNSSHNESSLKNTPDSVREKVEILNKNEIRKFNLTKNSIDESQLIEKFNQFNTNYPYNKIKELKKDKIVWATWRSKRRIVMWPSKVVNVIKEKTTLKVCIRYFEINGLGRVFKMKPSEVELFFRSVDEHYSYKEMATTDKQLCYAFLKSYSDALEAFVEQFKEDDLNESNELNNIRTKKNNYDPNGYLIYGKSYTLEELKELAKRPISEEQIKINNERETFSKSLFDLIFSEECKDYIISIMTGKVECKRHSNYLVADFFSRKKLKFCSPGPLVDEHQKEIAQLIIKLSEENYLNKPKNLNNYEYDVLYPEAVTWALKKLKGLSQRKAETEYKVGFKRTEEELIKLRSNEILSKLPKTIGIINENKYNDESELADLTSFEIMSKSSLNESSNKNSTITSNQMEDGDIDDEEDNLPELNMNTHLMVIDQEKKGNDENSVVNETNANDQNSIVLNEYNENNLNKKNTNDVNDVCLNENNTSHLNEEQNEKDFNSEIKNNVDTNTEQLMVVEIDNNKND